MTYVPDKDSQARLERLYRIAVSITDTPEDAHRLLEATTARVQATVETTPHGSSERFAHVLRTMFAIQREVKGERGGTATFEAGPAVNKHDALDQLQLMRSVLQEILPVVWATLSEEHRLLLTLGIVEAFDEEEIALMIDGPAAEVAGRLQTARDVLAAALWNELTSAQKTLAERTLAPELVTEAVRKHVRKRTGIIPSRLRESLSKTLLPALYPPPPALPTRPRQAPQVRRTPSARRSTAPSSRLATFFRYGLVAMVIILTVGIVGYFTAQYVEQAPEMNVIALSADRAPQITPIFRTDQLDEAERFIYDQQGTRLILPSIDKAVLIGASLTQIAPGVEVPTILYEENTGDEIALYAYNYRLLDRHSDRLHMTTDVLRQIEDDTHYDIHNLGQSQVLIWRYRSTIYLAVTQRDAAELRDRIIMPS